MKVFSARKILGKIFTAMGVVFFAIGLGMGWFISDFTSRAVEATATIIDITQDNGDDSHEVYVEYKYDGQMYTAKSDFYSTGMHIGDTIQIFIDQNDPHRFATQLSQLLSTIFVPLGAAFILAGVLVFVSLHRQRSKREELLSHGERVEAQITKVELVRSIHMNGRHPYRILCSYTDGGGNAWAYKSDYMREDPSPVLQGRQSVPVYVDTYDKNSYYIPLEEL